jgi:hypothetical protein
MKNKDPVNYNFRVEVSRAGSAEPFMAPDAITGIPHRRLLL